ncbi:MAG: methyltransferase domain-containing protein [Alphaproteobacteria bacterium]|nr:methyltransferase domain-containing protein [Alphaproteobacteria bacterium]
MSVELLTEAVRHHEAGRLDEAEALYRKVLAEEPDQPDALHLLGVLAQQRGEHAAAVELLRQAVAQDPKAPIFHTHLGFALEASGKPTDAIAHYEAALTLEPKLAPARHQMADTLLALGRAAEAVPHYETLLEADPGNSEFHAKLGAIQSDSGLHKEACGHFEAALRQHPDNALLQIGLVYALARMAPETYEARHASLMERAFGFTHVSHQALARPAAHLVKQRHGIGGGAKAADALFADALLQALLKKTVNADGELELFLTDLRREFLFSDTLAAAQWPFLAALAAQGFNNEYVFWVSEEEEARLGELKAGVEAALAAKAEPEAAFCEKLLLLALYEPLHRLAGAGKLTEVPLDAWPAPLRPVLRQALVEPLEEEASKARIPSLTEIRDATSRAVQSQYEANPYPRWLSIDRPAPATLAQALAQLLPREALPDFLAEEAPEVLIAGCGTGKHAALRALAYGDAKITAVDLSKSSLAYARRMSRALGIGNLTFHQGDILDLDALKRQFPLIECAGVLHHMKEPEKGWTVLTRLLRPGGLMLIGLYGEAARKDIVEARARIAELGLQPVAKDIRDFRHAMLTGEHDACAGLMVFHDFFALSGCRDLIFHVQEHRYTIPQIEKMIADQGLEFLGFQFYEDALGIRNLYRKEYPADAAMTDLACWARFEEAHPGVFAEMLGYLFWCRKPAENGA